VTYNDNWLSTGGASMKKRDPCPQETNHVRVEHLAEHTDTIPLLAAWLLAEWGYLLPGETQATISANIAGRTHRDRIPQTFVALDSSRAVGMASIEAHDMVTRPELTPWLTGVYVLPECRQCGVGSALVQAVMDAAVGLGQETLYLFTPDRMTFYRRLGWRDMEQVRYQGVEVVIMINDLHS
jgi:GNAT superfamily N-acetyltransferase